MSSFCDRSHCHSNLWVVIDGQGLTLKREISFFGALGWTLARVLFLRILYPLGDLGPEASRHLRPCTVSWDVLRNNDPFQMRDFDSLT
jgi:hypothetical protein